MRMFPLAVGLVSLGLCTTGAQLGAATAAKDAAASTAVPKAANKLGNKPGGKIELIFTDGHRKVMQRDGFGFQPHVSRNGTAGWVAGHGLDANGRLVPKDVLLLRIPDGKIRRFDPSEKFISKWAFADHDSTVVISSMGWHGSSQYIRYNVATGAVTGSVEQYKPYKELPGWAKPVAEPD